MQTSFFKCIGCKFLMHQAYFALFLFSGTSNKEIHDTTDNIYNLNCVARVRTEVNVCRDVASKTIADAVHIDSINK